jgi:hypothetical protein
MAKKQKINKWDNGCRFHEGEAELSIQGKRLKFIVCLTCGATGPYGENEAVAIRRWYEGVTTDELGQNHINPRPAQGKSVPSDTGDSGVPGDER